MLSGGRLRLGIGNGWNPVEFTALGANFHDRGKRIEEQLEVLRALWTQELVTFEGRWHHIRDAGINPLPVQRPIPVWFGGGLNEPVLRRIARLGDGWIPGFNSPTEPEFIERMRGYVREAGRDPSDLKIERLIEMREGTPESWAKQIGAYRDMGVDYVSGGDDVCGLHLGRQADQGDRAVQGRGRRLHGLTRGRRPGIAPPRCRALDRPAPRSVLPGRLPRRPSVSPTQREALR